MTPTLICLSGFGLFMAWINGTIRRWSRLACAGLSGRGVVWVVDEDGDGSRGGAVLLKVHAPQTAARTMSVASRPQRI
jgi:hypothetical protein